MTGLLPIKNVDPAEMEALRRNITSVYNSAATQQKRQGDNWYREAHNLAKQLTTSGDATIGAGVIAALSANTAWEHNVTLAREALTSGLIRHTRNAASKAERIMAGETPIDVLPMHKKTGHFYRNILDPDDAWPVTVDRHAHDIAAGMPYGNGERGLDVTARYNMVAGLYRTVADRLGVLPNVLQATTWVVWREQLHGK